LNERRTYARHRRTTARWSTQAGGAKFGYPALSLDAEGSLIHVDVFESPALPRHRHRLDAFEGPGYRRVAVEVATLEGVLPASIYVLAKPTDPS
jgi:gamma-glutamylcyclotransferase (GGCT)/AIG2-like uncharacterized protein YtfP